MIGQQLVENSAERIDVRACVEFVEFSRSLLGRHVRRRAHDRTHHRLAASRANVGLHHLSGRAKAAAELRLPADGRTILRDTCGRDSACRWLSNSRSSLQASRAGFDDCLIVRTEVFGAGGNGDFVADRFDVHHFGQAPVQDKRFAKRSDHHVQWLEVSMQDTSIVSKRHRVADVDKVGNEFAKRQCPFGAVPGELMESLDLFFHRLAADEFHRVERRSVFLIADIVNRNDARVFELSGDLSFFQETFQCVSIFQRAGQQFFERDFAA